MTRRKALKIAGVVAALMLIASLLNYVRFRRDFARWQDHPPDHGRTAQIIGAELNYTLRGEGAPLIVMEGGLGTISSKWQPLAEKLSEYGTVLAYDRGDYGHSHTANYPRDPAAISRELEQLMDIVGADSPVLYVGHSFGANQILEHALNMDRTVIGVIMIDPAPVDSEAFFRSLLKDDRLSSKARGLVESTLDQDSLFAMEFFGSSGLMYGLYSLLGGEPEYRSIVLTASSADYYKALRSEIECSRTTYTEAEWEKLSALPLVLITSNHEALHEELEQDHGLTAQESTVISDALHGGKLEYLPLFAHSRLAEAETGEHAVHLFEPELVIEAVDSLLSGK